MAERQVRADPALRIAEAVVPHTNQNPGIQDNCLNLSKIDTVETINIDILNPKAKKLLKDLADLDLIKINRETKRTDFSDLLKRIRNKSNDKISLDEITKEVEQVRKARYEK